MRCDSLLAGRPEFDKVVENETRELLLVIDNVPVSGHNAATIIKAVKSAKLPPNTEETVIARIVQLLSTPRPFPPASHASGQPSMRGGPHNVGISYQDFTSIINYIPQKVWRFCHDSRNGLPILKVAVALGLRRGSEKTFKVSGLCVLCSTCGIEYVSAIEPSMRTTTVKSTKKELEKVASIAGETPLTMSKLPSTPDELKESQPELYADVFRVEPLVPNPFDPVAWGMLVSGTKCRKDRGVGIPGVVSCSKFASFPADNQPASVFMAELQSMRQELRAVREGGDIQLSFPNRAGNATRDDGVPVSCKSGAPPWQAKQPVLAIMPPQPPTNPADAATPEQEVPPAGKRIGVEEATAAILSNMKKKRGAKGNCLPTQSLRTARERRKLRGRQRPPPQWPRRRPSRRSLRPSSVSWMTVDMYASTTSCHANPSVSRTRKSGPLPRRPLRISVG